jgi:nitronate monooxygenase
MPNTLKPLMIGDLELKIPIIQGGMGVRLSLAPLAAAVANCGGGGTIAVVGLPPDTEENRKDKLGCQREYLRQEIRDARKLSKGAIGVNIMVALSNYEDMARTAAMEGVDYIISGAGMPLSLPEFVKGYSTKLIPVISSARGAALLLKTWKRRYNRLPDAIIVEGPLSGGHIAGMNIEQLRLLKDDIRKEPVLENSVKEVLELAGEYERENNVSMPVIAAGGVFDGKDLAKFLKMGAKGVQIGSRFIATTECSAAKEFKDLYVNACSDDIVYIQSPVGMPAKILKTKFSDKILRGEGAPFICDYQCLRTCNPAEVPYCIAKALVNAAKGDLDEGIVLAGTNVTRIKKIVSAKELIDEIVTEAAAELATAVSSPAVTRP